MVIRIKIRNKLAKCINLKYFYIFTVGHVNDMAVEGNLLTEHIEEN